MIWKIFFSDSMVCPVGEFLLNYIGAGAGGVAIDFVSDMRNCWNEVSMEKKNPGVDAGVLVLHMSNELFTVA